MSKDTAKYPHEYIIDNIDPLTILIVLIDAYILTYMYVEIFGV